MIRLLIPALVLVSALHAAEPYELKLETITQGYDGKMCWVHARAGAIPGSPPQVVLTMQKLLLTGSDVFYALNHLSTSDLGKTWTQPVDNIETLGRREEPDGVIVAACDFTPKWHAKSGKLLGIGHTVRYRDNKVIHDCPRQTTFSVYDPLQSTWTPWATLAMPEGPKFYNAGAGCVQRVDLENGDILLPIYFHAKGEKHHRVTVLRCSFDGSTLRFIEQGNDLVMDSARGFAEPSLIRCAGKYFLTLRHDLAGYVCASDDGLHFSEPTRWNWTDGSDLGNYNTQQHWVAHKDSLYLVYTRKGANNDHVFRHRAPLFMAEVDKDSLSVKRGTERILVPERGARLGNFGVCEVSENETWVTVTEWMQKNSPDIIIKPDNKYGADNSVYAARILWQDAK